MWIAIGILALWLFTLTAAIAVMVSMGMAIGRAMREAQTPPGAAAAPAHAPKRATWGKPKSTQENSK